MRSDGDEDDNAMLICRCCGRRNAWKRVGSRLPIKDRREELGDEAFIVWAEGLGVHRTIALAV